MIAGVRRYLARRALTRAATDPRLLQYATLKFAVPRRMGLRDVRFVVLDTEATGLDMTKNRLLSLAAVAVRAGQVDLDDRLELTFASKEVGGREAAEIHQLVCADVKDGVTEEVGTLDFIDYLRDSVLVAHHVGFDVAMINRVLARIGPVRVYNRLIDTLVLDRRLTNGPHPTEPSRDEDRSLDGLCSKFGVDTPMRHSAAGDALATAQLLLALLAKAEKRGIRTVGALLAR